MIHRLLALLFLTTLVASGQTTIGSWRLGEDDSSPTNGGAVTTSVADAGALGNLTASGAVTYSTSVPAGLGSTWSVALGSSSPSLALGSNLGVNNNYAIEAWVKPTATSGVQLIFSNGNTSADGMALLVNGGKWDIQVSGTSAKTGSYTLPDVTAGTWSHLALVMDNGTPYLYFNGTSFSASGLSYTAASSAFSIGGFNFEGGIDDVNVFTFTSGTFNSSMLSYSAVPEPSTYAALAGLAALGMVAWRRRGSVRAARV